MKASIFDTLKSLSFPLLHILAPYGKSKTRLLETLTEITPYVFYLIDVKSAPLKRISSIYEAVLYVDEKTNMDSELASILNAKYNKKSMILNADLERQHSVSALIGYCIFGPITIASRIPFNDALESKSFQLNLDH